MALILLSGCFGTFYPAKVSESDKYGIIIKFNNHTYPPAPTDLAIQLASAHCRGQGKEAIHISGYQPDTSFEETHKFRCVSKKPVIDFASENSISILHDNESYGSTTNAEVLDLAIKHCEKHGKGMKLLSSSSVKESTENLHTFMCSNDFTDQRIEVEIK